MEFNHVYMCIKKKTTIDDLLVVITSNHRFMLEVKIAPNGTLAGGKRQYTPLRVKAIQHHNNWSYQNVEGLAGARALHRPWPSITMASSLVCH